MNQLLQNSGRLCDHRTWLGVMGLNSTEDEVAYFSKYCINENNE